MSSPISSGVRSAARALVGAWVGGRWQIEAVLGTGGAASVFSAVDARGTRVAIKVLHPVVAAERISVTRFRREAYVANRVAHPGVPRVLDDGMTDAGLPYLVMELVEGESAEARRVRRGGRLPIDEVVWIGDRALSILAAAHARGIVHRDIKPEHLILTRDRELKLLDFGIARLSEGAGLTSAGAILGTLAFMPPEQARGDLDRVGEKSDLWALAATLYTLLSGTLPRSDDSVSAALSSAVKDAVPSLADVAPDVPREIVDVIDYALALDAAARWPDAIMMQRTLRRAFVRVKRSSARLWKCGDFDDDSEVGVDVDAATFVLEAPELDSFA